jgi:hypothetical protein
LYAQPAHDLRFQQLHPSYNIFIMANALENVLFQLKVGQPDLQTVANGLQVVVHGQVPESPGNKGRKGGSNGESQG